VVDPSLAGRPKGQPRPVIMSMLLAVVTLGIFTFYWTYRTHQEIKDYSGMGVGGLLGVLIYFVFSPATFFLVPSEIEQMMTRSGQKSRVWGLTGLWVLLPLLGPIVWFHKVQGQLNEFWATAP
jgi:hypothetical protein